MTETFFHEDARIQSIQFECPLGKTPATLIVDGVDISKYVSSVEFYMTPEGAARAYIEVTLEIPDLKINGRAVVTYGTPPDESKSLHERKTEEKTKQARRRGRDEYALHRGVKG
jgi:hypothetical protein